MKVEVKVSDTLSVRSLPEVLKEEPVPLTVHWLFDTDPEEPGVTAGDSKASPHYSGGTADWLQDSTPYSS